MSKIYWIRKLKALFFRFRLHKIVPGKSLIFLGHLSELSKWINETQPARYSSDFYSKKFNYGKRFNLYQDLILKEKLDTSIDYLEFGVSTGSSLKWWLGNIENKQARFFGFDTFEGLPEDWGSFKKGDMSADILPTEILNDNRCKLYKGLFQDTLFDFLKSYKRQNRLVVHMDADIYSATLFVLTTLAPFLKKDDIILFDEFNVPLHEFKAFIEWTKSFYIDFEVLFTINNFYQIALKLR